MADPSPAAPSGAAGTIALQKCQPCGKSTCSFSADVRQFNCQTDVTSSIYLIYPSQGNPSYETHRLIVDLPVSNCDPKADSNVTSQFTKEMEVTETWSVDATIGVSYVGLQFSATVGWEKSVSQKVGQTVTMSIPPGRMVWRSPPFLSQHTILFFCFRAR